jgi:Spy/CpxP family protein refolding chaperone
MAGVAGPMAMFTRMGEELALTEPQKQELAALMEMYRPRIKELAQRGQENLRPLMDMAPDDPAYNKLATELSEQAGASAAEMVTLLTELQANAYALLTTEQQATFMAKRAEMRERMDKRKAEMEARREAGETGYGPGMGMGMNHGMGHRPCKGCAESEQDDETQESAE